MLTDEEWEEIHGEHPDVTAWRKIKAARAMQNVTDDQWAEPCGACLHELRDHEFSLELPQRCNHSSEQYNPYERATVKVVCTCQAFQPTR